MDFGHYACVHLYLQKTESNPKMTPMLLRLSLCVVIAIQLTSSQTTPEVTQQQPKTTTDVNKMPCYRREDRAMPL